MILLRNIVSMVVIALMVSACNRGSVDSQVDDSDSEGTEGEFAAEQDDTVRSNQQGTNDSNFAVNAVDGGMLEVRLGELAMKQSKSPLVKGFAQAMTTDHGKANDELKTIAANLKIAIPDNLTDKSQQKYDELAQLKGADFEKAYADLMVKDHQETIEIFRAEANNGQQTELKEWAKEKLPTLEHHLKMAQDMKDGTSAPGQ